VYKILKECNHPYIKNSIYEYLLKSEIFSSSKQIKRTISDLKNMQLTKRIKRLPLHKKFFEIFNYERWNVKKAKTFIKIVLYFGKKDNNLIAKLNQIQYEFYYLYLDFLEKGYLNLSFFEKSLLGGIFSKDEFKELFTDILNEKDTFKYEKKIVEYFFKQLGIDTNKNVLMQSNITGFKFFTDDELKYSWNENSFFSRFGISRKEYKNIRNGNNLISQKNFFKMLIKKNEELYLEFCFFWCLEKLRKKYLV
jgi:hypothetical protein